MDVSLGPYNPYHLNHGVPAVIESIRRLSPASSYPVVDLIGGGITSREATENAKLREAAGKSGGFGAQDERSGGGEVPGGSGVDVAVSGVAAGSDGGSEYLSVIV